jgi:curved DNA-binding protein
VKFKDYYQILGIEPGANDAALKAAFRKQARKYHPDVSQEKSAEERFKDVNEAYDTLKDADKRSAYDQLRSSGIKPGEEINPHAGPGAGFGGFDFNMGDGGDIFESLFGRRRAPPRDERVQLTIDLEKAHSGGAQRIVLARAGHERALEVKIPAGITSGQVIRLAGQGQSPNGRSDLLLEIQVAPHPLYRLQGRDTYSTLQLMPWEAALGCTRAVATLSGSVELSIPENSNTGRKMRLKGRGFAKPGGAEFGDHYIEIAIANPAILSPVLRESYLALAEKARAAGL